MLVAALFTQNDGEPATGLTLADIAITLNARNKTTAAVTTIWHGVAPTEEVGGGYYSKDYATADQTLYDYFAYAVYGGAEVLDSNYSLQASVGVDNSAAAVWAYTQRTLTQSAASVAAVVAGSAITILRGDSLSVALTGLGNIAARTKLYFTLKNSHSHLDAASVIQIEETAGLLYLNASAGTAINGDITVTDAATGALTVTLAASETAKLVPASGLAWDIQMVTATGVDTLTNGTAYVVGDVTRAVS
jgi:hypothetical protein